MTPQPEVCWYWCGGSSPAPWVPCPLPPHLSADTLLPAELNQLTPAFTQQLWPTHWQLLLRTNERSRAAKAHLVYDWTLTVDTRQPSFRPEFGATWRTSSHSFGSYLPTVWLASCLIRLNCFFILCVSVLPPDGRATSRISLIEWSQISAPIYGRRQGSVLKHPVSGNIHAKSSPFLLSGDGVSLSTTPFRCLKDAGPISLLLSPETDSSLATWRFPQVHYGKWSKIIPTFDFRHFFKNTVFSLLIDLLLLC